MTPTLHMSVEKPTGSKATTSGAMNSGVPCNTFTGVPGAAEKTETMGQMSSWDLLGAAQLHPSVCRVDEPLRPGGAAALQDPSQVLVFS